MSPWKNSLERLEKIRKYEEKKKLEEMARAEQE